MKTMSKKAIIERTIKAINQLPDEKAEEVSYFVDYILKRYEEEILLKGIQQIVEESDAFQFLAEEEDLYSIDDLKVRFHDKR